MNTVQRIAKNTGVLLISQIVSRVLSFFYIIYTARYLGAEGFGILSFALAFTGIFGIFTDLGLSTLTVREVARNKSLTEKYLGNVVIIKLVLVVIVFGLIVLIINFFGYPEQTIKVVYLIALSTVCNAFSQIFYSIFQSHEKMEYQSLSHILSSILMFSGVLYAINQSFSIVIFAYIYFVVSAVILGYNCIICSCKFVLLRIEFDLEFWKLIIKKALPFGLSGIFITIYYRIDSVMLSLMKGNDVVGWYNAAYKLVFVLSFIPVIFFSSVFPVMSKYYKSSRELLKLTFEKSFKYLLIVAVPIGVGTTILSDRIILLIFGTEYIPSIIALKILIWSEVLIFLNVTFGNLLNSIDKQIVVTKQTLIAAISNIIMNLILIPKYSYVGASIATVLTECFAFIFLFSAISRSEYKMPKRNIVYILKILLASLFMGIFIKYFKYCNIIILVFLAAVIYFTIIYIIGVIDKTDIKIFKQLAGARKDL